MPISTLNYDNPTIPSTGASIAAVNWITEGSGSTQLSVLSDGTGTGIPLGTSENPIQVEGTFYQETQNVSIVDSSGISFGTDSNPLVVDQSNIIEQLVASNARFGSLLNDAYSRPFYDVTSQVYRPVLGALSVNNFPANVQSSRVLNGLNSQVSVSMASAESVGIVITGTFSGTITFEASVDGVTWASCFAMPIAATAPVSSATAAGTWIASLGGMAFFRARCSAYTSGQPTVSLTASVVTSLNQVYSAAATGFLCTASQGGTWTVQPGNTPNTSAWLTSSRGTASVTGGYTKLRRLASADTNLVSVKGTAGMIYELILTNNTAASKFFKLYNKATAPVSASDTPTETIVIQPNSTLFLRWSNGNPFTTGIAFAITGAIGDTDTTALVANDVVMNMYYL